MFRIKGVFASHPGPFAVDTLRAATILLVVLYHVIGSGKGAGLHLSAPSPWRFLADILNDIHMPVFAALSGLVYAMRPVSVGGAPAFLVDKLRRLALPGAVAIGLFSTMARIVPSGFSDPRPIWTYMVYPYAHFWFLQAIFVIFVMLLVTDILSRNRAGGILLVVGLAVLVSGWRASTGLMAVNGAIWLLPYAALGTLMWRNRRRVLGPARGWLVGLAVAAIGLALVCDIAQIGQNGRVDPVHASPMNIALGLGACVAGLLLVPHLRWLAWLGAPSFAIYLYHPLFTSATRRVLEGLGVTDVPLHLVAGMVVGTLGPVVIHVAAMQSGLTRRVVLGLRR